METQPSSNDNQELAEAERRSDLIKQFKRMMPNIDMLSVFEEAIGGADGDIVLDAIAMRLNGESWRQIGRWIGIPESTIRKKTEIAITIMQRRGWMTTEFKERWERQAKKKT